MYTMLKFFGKMYLRSVVVASINRARNKPLQEVFEEIFKLLREIEGEANDSALYEFVHQKFVDASRNHLKHVSESLRPNK